MKHSLLLSLALLPLLANALTIDEVVQQTVKTHPQVQMDQENYLAEKELLTRVKSGYLPSVDLTRKRHFCGAGQSERNALNTIF